LSWFSLQPGALRQPVRTVAVRLLPPPFVIPMFMARATEEDANYVVNTLTLATLVTLVAYALVPTIFPPLL
jgi:hypothetical protein